MCSDPLTLRLGAVLIPLLLSWSSLICVAPSLDLLLLSAFDLPSVICPFICCPCSRVFAARKDDTLSWGFISHFSVAAGFNSSVA
jgi:hypothetical protein